MFDAFVEDIESVEETDRDNYIEVTNEDGTIRGYKFQLKEVNGWANEDVGNLKKTVGKERSDRKSYEKKYNSLSKKFEGVDVEELQKEAEDYKAKYEKLAEIDPESEAAKLAEEKVKLAEEKVNSKLEQKQKEWNDQYKKEVGSREEKINKLTSKVKELLIDNVATNALVEAGIIQEDLELILPKVTGTMRLVESEDGEFVSEIVDKDGVARVRSDGNSMTVRDLIPELQERWPRAFSADVKTGGGMKTSKTIVTKKQEDLSSKDKIKNGLAARMKQ